MRRIWVTLASAAFAFLISGTALAQQSEDPGEVVQSTVNQVLDVLRDSNMSLADKRAQVYALVDARTDFEDMSRRILAVNWKTATEEQRAEFVKLFKQILLDTYWAKIKTYTNEEVQFLTGMITGNDYATVDSFVITTKNVKIPISYRMHLVNGKWLAYDFVVEKLSMITTYRSDYSSRIKDGGMDGLFKGMEEDIKKLNANHATETASN